MRRILFLLAITFVVTACGSVPTSSSDANTISANSELVLLASSSNTKDHWPAEWYDPCSQKLYSGWMKVHLRQSMKSDGSVEYFVETVNGHGKLYAEGGRSAEVHQKSGSKTETDPSGFTSLNDSKWQVVTQGKSPNSTLQMEMRFEFRNGVFVAEVTSDFRCQGQ